MMMMGNNEYDRDAGEDDDDEEEAPGSVNHNSVSAIPLPMDDAAPMGSPMAPLPDVVPMPADEDVARWFLHDFCSTTLKNRDMPLPRAIDCIVRMHSALGRRRGIPLRRFIFWCWEAEARPVFQQAFYIHFGQPFICPGLEEALQRDSDDEPSFSDHGDAQPLTRPRHMGRGTKMQMQRMSLMKTPSADGNEATQSQKCSRRRR